MTEDALGLLALRLIVGGIFVAQGYRKLLAPADASHGRGNLQRMIASAGLPFARQQSLMVSTFELVCGGMLLVGLATRLACLPLLAILLVAIRLKFPAGFFGGWDWPLSVFGGVLALLLIGPGSISLDALIAAGAR